VNDFEPISLITDTPLLIVAKKAMPANDLKSLIAWLKANPDKASAGTGGGGSAEHVTGVLFQNTTGTRFQFVPYRGSGPRCPDCGRGGIAGVVLFALDVALGAQGHAERCHRETQCRGEGSLGRSERA
jgi:tripartite-type tricarboxylate transporter receptor subunit TctC